MNIIKNCTQMVDFGLENNFKLLLVQLLIVYMMKYVSKGISLQQQLLMKT